MKRELIRSLPYVLWIGGATDCGKSTVAQQLAQRHRLQVYHYDKRDLAHHEELAQTTSVYRTFLNTSLDERWVYPEPAQLFHRMLRSFRDRFPLVIEDLLAFSREQLIVAEGFGLLPELLVPLLSSPRQAVWLVPTEAFKWASMIRRGKPSFSSEVSDPHRAKLNLFRRDRLLAEYIKEQVLSREHTLYEVDGSCSVEEMTDLIEKHFSPYFAAW
jgi:adenylate kinase family enzyme